MAWKEAECLYSDQMQASITKVAEDSFLDVFQMDFELLKNGLKNNSYDFIEHTISQMGQNDALDDLFNRSIERWTQSSVFKNVFIRRAQTTSRSVCSVPKFIHENLKEQCEVINQAKNPLYYSLPFHRQIPAPASSQKTMNTANIRGIKTVNMLSRITSRSTRDNKRIANCGERKHARSPKAL